MNHDEQSSKQIDAVLELICRDTPARRELLWLRAVEAEDPFSLALLERGDPTLRCRMTALLAQRGLPGPDHPDSRKKAFAAFWQEHFATLAARIAAPIASNEPAPDHPFPVRRGDGQGEGPPVSRRPTVPPGSRPG